MAAKQGTRAPAPARARTAMARRPSTKPARLSSHEAGLLALQTPGAQAQLDRADLACAAGAAVAAALIFLTTFSTHVALGDAPESVAGVHSLGILHAPGYPSYVLFARGFASVFAIGSWAARVNAFSLVCAALSIGVVTLIARSCGASRLGASVGALALGTTASFWLNADFAKHYPFTMLTAALPILFVLIWQQRGSRGWLLAGAAALGLAFGSGWQLAAIVAVSIAAMLRIEPPRPGRRDLAFVGGAFAIVFIALWVFVMVRAGQHPTVNWGEASSPARVSRLILRRDFEGVHSGNAGASANFFGRAAGRSAGLVRDFGWGAAALAVVGIAAWRRMRREVRALLLVAGVLNLLAVAIDSTLGAVNGFLSVIPQGGYMLVVMLTVAVLTALGITAIGDYLAARERARANTPSAQRGSRALPVWAPSAVATACAIAVLVPSLIVHRAHANLRAPAFADGYGHRMLESLPHDAVLLVWGSEYAMPMIYRQEIDHERPDVAVIAADTIIDAWGREQIARQLHIAPLVGRNVATSTQDLLAKVMKIRPLYLDTFAMNAMLPVAAYETQGLVGKVVSGKPGARTVANVDALARALVADERADHLDRQTWDKAPFQVAFWERARAHVELAKVYAIQKNRTAVIRELRRAVAIFPVVPNVPTALHLILAEHPTADQLSNVVADL